MKRFHAALTLLILSFLLIAQAIAFADNDIPRQVDPSKVQEQNPYPSSLLQFYQGISRLISTGNFSFALSQLNSTGLIHIPSQLQFIYSRFNSLLSQAASQLQQVNSSIDKAQLLLQQGNPNAANSTIYQAYYQLSLANVTINQLMSASPQMESSFGLPSGQLQNQVNQLVSLESNYKSVLDSLAARISNLIIALQTDRAFSTRIFLNVSETQVYLGNNITLYGRLATSRNLPLANKNIQISSSSLAIRQNIQTDSQGNFQLSLQIPYVYTSYALITASYIPSGDDANTYLASSANLTVKLLYYQPSISLSAPHEVLPGSYLQVKGSLSSSNSSISAIKLAAFGLQQTLQPANSSFTAVIPVPSQIQDGIYTIQASSEPSGLTAPASASSQIIVSRLNANLTFSSPAIIFGGQNLLVSGRAFSSNGTPLSGSMITAAFGNMFAQGKVNGDGSFELHISVPFLSTTGNGKIIVAISPSQPWVEQVSLSKNITAISPAAIIMPIAFLILGIALYQRRARPLNAIKEASAVFEPQERKRQLSSDVVNKYMDILSRLEKKGLRIRRSETLREYLQRVKINYPDIADDFSSLTGIVEDEIYGFGASEDDKHAAILISQKLLAKLSE